MLLWCYTICKPWTRPESRCWGNKCQIIIKFNTITWYYGNFWNHMTRRMCWVNSVHWQSALTCQYQPRRSGPPCVLPTPLSFLTVPSDAHSPASSLSHLRSGRHRTTSTVASHSRASGRLAVLFSTPPASLPNTCMFFKREQKTYVISRISRAEHDTTATRGGTRFYTCGSCFDGKQISSCQSKTIQFVSR